MLNITKKAGNTIDDIWNEAFPRSSGYSLLKPLHFLETVTPGNLLGLGRYHSLTTMEFQVLGRIS